jgi:signal transduction histidine kinase
MRRLYTKIYFHFVGVLIVVALVTSAIFAIGWRGAFARNFTERLARLGSSLVSREAGDPKRRDRMIRHLAEELDLDVTYRDASGKALVVIGHELPALVPATDDELRRGPTVRGRGKGFFVAAPVRDPSTHDVIGALQATPARRFRPGILLVLWPGVTMAAVLLAIGILVAPLARRLSRPVEKLTEASRRLGQGELGYRVELDHHDRWRERMHRRHRRHGRTPRADELTELTRAWNEMAERIERMVRGQRELLANVSHELRSPLGRMKMALELLPETEANRARVADLQQDLGELERLIDDVLTTSRLDATGLPTHVERVDVAALFAALVDRAASDPLTARVEVRIGAVEIEALDGDPALLRRALFNLIENAAKYGRPPITLAAHTDGDRVALSVTDEGECVPEADRARAFEPFARGDAARTPTPNARGGFGLGLTLARRVAEVHGGTATIADARPTPPRGCVVTITVPARTAS